MKLVSVVKNMRTGKIVDKFYEGDSYIKLKKNDDRNPIYEVIFVHNGKVTDHFSSLDSYIHYTHEDRLRMARISNQEKEMFNFIKADDE